MVARDGSGWADAAGGRGPSSINVFSEIRSSIDGLGQAILDASLQLKHTVGDAGPASSHQHCGRDIQKSEDYHQNHHEAGGLLRLSSAIPGPVDPQVKVGGEHRASPQGDPTKTCQMMRLKRES